MNGPPDSQLPPPLPSSEFKPSMYIIAGVMAMILILLLCMMLWLASGGAGTGGVAGGGNGTGNVGDGTGAGDTQGQDGSKGTEKSDGSAQAASDSDGFDAEQPEQTEAASSSNNSSLGHTTEEASELDSLNEAAESTAASGKANSQHGQTSKEELQKYEADPSFDAGQGLMPSQEDVGFFGVESSGKHIAYVIDISSSMSRGRLALAKRELIKSLKGLNPQQKFSVFFFNSNVVSVPKFIDKEATEKKVAQFEAWLPSVVARGGTNPLYAMQSAFRAKCDVVFLLSDGAFPDGMAAQITSMNQHEATVNTISLGMNNKSMQEISKNNNGAYVEISK